MTERLRRSLAQRADYTHKHNAESGRHGWLRLTPAYSLKIVGEILLAYEGISKINFAGPGRPLSARRIAVTLQSRWKSTPFWSG